MLSRTVYTTQRFVSRCGMVSRLEQNEGGKNMNPIAKMMKRYIKTPLKYALPLLFIGALVLVSTTGCVNNNNPTAAPTAQATVASTATPAATATPTATATPSGQGTASDNDFSLAATNRGIYTESNQFEQPSAGDKYVQIYVELTNKNAQNAMMGNQFQFTLFDNQNIGHQAATASFGAPNSLQSLDKSNPGEKTAGVIVFEMPAGNTPMKLVYDEQTSLSSGSLTVNF
jgi:hypothetical protein